MKWKGRKKNIIFHEKLPVENPSLLLVETKGASPLDSCRIPSTLSKVRPGIDLCAEGTASPMFETENLFNIAVNYFISIHYIEFFTWQMSLGHHIIKNNWGKFSIHVF